MKLRLIAAAGLAASMTMGGLSHAAPVCNLVVDDKGDGTTLTIVEGAGQNDPAFDIVSADVATDSKNLTAVIRVEKLSKTASSAPTGLHWRFDFTPSTGSQVFTQAKIHPVGGETFSAGYINAQGTSSVYSTPGTGVFDLAKNEVRVTVPLSIFAEQAVIKNGTKIGTLSPNAGRYWSAQGSSPSLSEPADTAEGAKTYTAGAKSCVKVGA